MVNRIASGAEQAQHRIVTRSRRIDYRVSLPIARTMSILLDFRNSGEVGLSSCR